MSNQRVLNLIFDDLASRFREWLGLTAIANDLKKLENSMTILGGQLLENIAIANTAIAEVAVTLAVEAEEIKNALAQSASLNDPAILSAIASLESFKVQLGAIKDTAAGLIPNVETPEEPTEPTEPIPSPVEPMPEIPEVELPIEVTVPDSGIDGAPALDFE